MTFENRRFFKKQRFVVGSSTLKDDISTLFESSEYEISLEQINAKRTIQVVFRHGLFVSSLFAFAVGGLLFFAPNEEAASVFFLVAAVCFTTAFLFRKRVVTITAYDGNKIELFFDQGNRGDVVAFADQIIEASNRYLLRKYGKIDPALPINPQIDNIQFLRNREIITEEEYEALKNQLLGKSQKATIGFGY